MAVRETDLISWPRRSCGWRRNDHSVPPAENVLVDRTFFRGAGEIEPSFGWSRRFRVGTRLLWWRVVDCVGDLGVGGVVDPGGRNNSSPSSMHNAATRPGPPVAAAGSSAQGPRSNGARSEQVQLVNKMMSSQKSRSWVSLRPVEPLTIPRNSMNWSSYGSDGVPAWSTRTSHRMSPGSRSTSLPSPS